MGCNWRHVPCPDCGVDVWRFTSKSGPRKGQYYYCDQNTFNANYHECKGPTPRPLTVEERPQDVKFQGEPPRLSPTADEEFGEIGPPPNDVYKIEDKELLIEIGDALIHLVRLMHQGLKELDVKK